MILLTLITLKINKTVKKVFYHSSLIKMEPLIVNTTIKSPIEKVWEYFTHPEHIVNWNFAHESWECPKAWDG